MKEEKRKRKRKKIDFMGKKKRKRKRKGKVMCSEKEKGLHLFLTTWKAEYVSEKKRLSLSTKFQTKICQLVPGENSRKT